jgi:hypothetical protein
MYHLLLMPYVVHGSMPIYRRCKVHLILTASNIDLQACITWAQSHLNATSAKDDLAKLLNAKPCRKKSRAGSVFTPYDATIGRRIAQISSALRCKWVKVSDWTCSSCAAVPNFKVLTAYQVPTADPDGFLVSFDDQLNALVLTFRSTYCSTSTDCFSLQWLNNFQAWGKTITLPNQKSYNVHAGIHTTWASDLKANVMQALKDALVLYPTAPLYISGHSRGGAFATLAAAEVYFEAANLGLTNPSEQIKLYTMGSLRVGDGDFAALIENLLTTRFRIVNNADLVTMVPPAKVEWISKFLYLLGDVGQQLINISNTVNFYRHYGPIVLNIDTPLTKAVKICPDGECPDCLSASLLTLALGRSWSDTLFSRMMVDHAYYLGGIDMNNDNCKITGRDSYNPVIHD